MITLVAKKVVGEYEVFDNRRKLGEVVKVNVCGFDKWRNFTGKQTFDTAAAAVMDTPLIAKTVGSR